MGSSGGLSVRLDFAAPAPRNDRPEGRPLETIVQWMTGLADASLESGVRVALMARHTLLVTRSRLTGEC